MGTSSLLRQRDWGASDTSRRNPGYAFVVSFEQKNRRILGNRGFRCSWLGDLTLGQKCEQGLKLDANRRVLRHKSPMRGHRAENVGSNFLLLRGARKIDGHVLKGCNHPSGLSLDLDPRTPN